MNDSKNFSLEEINAKMVIYNTPIITFLLIFMALGMIGNLLVLYVYKFRMRVSTLNVFILYLGLVDMLGCCLGVPFDLVDQFFPFIYPSDILCKCQHFTIYYSCTASILTLFVITVERFNRMCRPLASQTSAKHAKWILIGVSCISLLGAFPTCLAFGREEKRLFNGVMSQQCLHSLSLSWKIYFLFLLSLFVVFLLVIFVLYFFIWKKAKEHFRQLETRRKRQANKETDRLTHTHQETRHISSQVNLTIFGITTLFVISFAPNFILNLIRPELSHEFYAFLGILHRLWVLNCSLNPVVYGICNGEFRSEFKGLFHTESSQVKSHIGTKNSEIVL